MTHAPQVGLLFQLPTPLGLRPLSVKLIVGPHALLADGELQFAIALRIEVKEAQGDDQSNHRLNSVPFCDEETSEGKLIPMPSKQKLRGHSCSEPFFLCVH